MHNIFLIFVLLFCRDVVHSSIFKEVAQRFLHFFAVFTVFRHFLLKILFLGCVFCQNHLTCTTFAAFLAIFVVFFYCFRTFVQHLHIFNALFIKNVVHLRHFHTPAQHSTKIKAKQKRGTCHQGKPSQNRKYIYKLYTKISACAEFSLRKIQVCSHVFRIACRIDTK